MKKVLRAMFVTGLLVSIAVAQSPWTLQTSPTTQRLRVMRPVSAQVVWACGNAGAVVRTVDGGTTWQLKTAPSATFNMYGLDAIDSSTAWVMGTASSVSTTGDTRIWKTTNGGATWTEQAKIADSWADGIRFFDASNGIAAGDPPQATKSKMTILTTADGGTTWTPIAGAGNPAVDSVADEVGVTNGMDITGTTAWIVTYGNSSAIQPRVLKSTDKGLTWTASPKIAIDNSYGFSMKDATTGITCNINSGSIAKTSNGWATADSMLVFGGVYGLRAIDWIPGTNSIVIVGGPSATGFSGLSKDGGKTWIPQTLPTGIARLYTVQFANSSTGWASDNVGKILKWTGGDLGASNDSVNVTFWANTSTVPDTMKANSFVQIRGSANLFGPWGMSSKAILSNVAGDYWKGTYKLKVGDTIQYKLFTNASSPLPLPAEHQGWENDMTDPSGNRILIVGSKDTTVPLQFVNGSPNKVAQYWTPYVNQKDSIEIWFRINMQSNESFAKATQFMGVRGGFAGTSYDGWSKSVVLTQETQHGNGGSRQYDGTNFWSGYVRVPKSTFASNIEYKFVIMDAPSLSANIIAWEDGIRPAPDVAAGGNRVISASPGVSDTTMYWKWWANNPYAGFKGQDTVIVTFRANLTQAIAQRGFTFSDTLQVRSGYGATAKEVRTKTMTRSGITGTIFTATDTVVASVGKQLNYQYYLVKSANDVREVFYDYDFTGSDVSQAERRKLSVTSKSMTVYDTTSVSTDMRRMPRFRNTTKLSKAVNVTFTMDLRPAYFQVARGDTLIDIQGTNNITKSSNIKNLGAAVNGPAVGGWAGWGPGLVALTDTAHKMYDDGTHGDVKANDSIYTIQRAFTTSDFIGQEFKFGIGGSDNEGGRGGFGNNHIENIDDSQTSFLLASQWGSINPKFYSAWDYDNHRPKIVAGQDSVKVTFWANTSTVPDTLKSNSFVQIRGSANLFGPWGMSSKAILSNVAGDYWKGTYKLKVGDTIQYKLFTNATSPLPLPAEHQGWENDMTDPSGNRILIVGSKDTTVPLQFVNGSPNKVAQYWTPYVNQKDSIEIWFRINMQSNESFNKNSQYMGVRGGFAGTPYDGWGKSVVLSKESQHGNGGSQQYDGTNFWSGYVRVPKSTFASNIEYKFVIMDAPSLSANIIAWEDGIRPAPDVAAGGNRVISASPGVSDTTMYWKWWANNPYAGFKGQDTIIVTFRANLSQAIAQRGFTFSDTLQVRSGYGATAKEVRTKAMTRSGITGTIFTATDTVISAVGKQLNYQYYLVKSGNDVREVFYDYDFSGTDVSQAERRKLNVTTKSLTVNDTSTSATDMRRMPRFRNSTKLSKAVTVTYTLNLRPAFLQVARGDTLFDIQGTNNIIKSSNIKQLGVGINGPAVGGWAGWGPAMIAPPDTVHKMYDDGTHGDAVAGDTIYSVRYKYTTSDQLGQEFKFGIGGSDNEGGKGGFGNNHIENIDDSQTTYVLASDWGSINPKYYSAWDFTNHRPRTATDVEDNWSVPMMYELSQNYPNPFNPSTTIQFALPAPDVVTLKIFNVLGQEVMTLLNEKMDAGRHTVRFDASKLTSGVYLYQVSAGKFVETKKMVLLK